MRDPRLRSNSLPATASAGSPQPCRRLLDEGPDPHRPGQGHGERQALLSDEQSVHCRPLLSSHQRKPTFEGRQVTRGLGAPCFGAEPRHEVARGDQLTCDEPYDQRRQRSRTRADAGADRRMLSASLEQSVSSLTGFPRSTREGQTDGTQVQCLDASLDGQVLDREHRFDLGESLRQTAGVDQHRNPSDRQAATDLTGANARRHSIQVGERVGGPVGDPRQGAGVADGDQHALVVRVRELRTARERFECAGQVACVGAELCQRGPRQRTRARVHRPRRDDRGFWSFERDGLSRCNLPLGRVEVATAFEPPASQRKEITSSSQPSGRERVGECSGALADGGQPEPRSNGFAVQRVCETHLSSEAVRSDLDQLRAFERNERLRVRDRSQEVERYGFGHRHCLEHDLLRGGSATDAPSHQLHHPGTWPPVRIEHPTVVTPCERTRRVRVGHELAQEQAAPAAVVEQHLRGGLRHRWAEHRVEQDRDVVEAQRLQLDHDRSLVVHRPFEIWAQLAGTPCAQHVDVGGMQQLTDDQGGRVVEQVGVIDHDQRPTDRGRRGKGSNGVSRPASRVRRHPDQRAGTGPTHRREAPRTARRRSSGRFDLPVRTGPPSHGARGVLPTPAAPRTTTLAPPDSSSA